MDAWSRLLLVGATGDARLDREALPSIREALAFGFLYTAGEPGCVALAEHIGDRLWLTPRCQLGLAEPRAWLELLRSHRYERIVAVVPAAVLELAPSSLADNLHCERTAPSVLQLSLSESRS